MYMVCARMRMRMHVNIRMQALICHKNVLAHSVARSHGSSCDLLLTTSRCQCSNPVAKKRGMNEG